MPVVPYSPNVIVSTSGALSAAAVRNSFLRSLVDRQEQYKQYMDILFPPLRKAKGRKNSTPRLPIMCFGEGGQKVNRA